ncbi:MAG: hypothetical protein OK439_06955 [Thaumarchaeota archaeon]|nr:hypothetical protein [Nitrososphaerota archaeon]
MSLFHAGKPRLSSVEYYPNNIGNLVLGTSQTYSFLVYGRDERGIQIQILNALHKRGAKILSQTGYVDGRSREFTLCVSCDLSEVSVTPDDLVIELRRIKLVKNALAVCLKNRMFDSFLFPLTIMLTNRVVSVDSNLTFLLQNRLNSEESNLALRDVGRAYAIDVIRQVREKLGSLPEEAIQENVKDYLKASGWGSVEWKFETSFVRVSIIDPPIYSGKATSNYFVQGIAAGLIEGLKKKKFTIAEEVYSQDSRSLAIMLAEIRSEVKRIEPVAEKPQESVGIKALEEVEKVIRSVELDALEIDVIPAGKGERPMIVLGQSGKTENVTKAPEPRAPKLPSTKRAEKENPESETLPELLHDQPKPVSKDSEVKKPIPDTSPKQEEKEIIPDTSTKQTNETLSPPAVAEKKPFKITEIKGIREKEEDSEEEADEIWFESAVQE